MSAGAPHPEIWVVVVSDDSGGMGGPEDPGHPIVMETRIEGATRAEAMRRAATYERRYGACRIARLVFE